jgi:integrase
MMPMVVSALTEWRKECPKGELGLAFPNTLGKVEMHTNILKRGWYPTQLAAWVLDRSGESALREEGDKFCELRPRKVLELLGHSSIQMTYDVYGHLFAADADDRAMLADVEQKLLHAV